MCTLLYRFDHLEALCMVEAHTTALAPVDIRMASDAGEPMLRVSAQRGSSELGEIRVVCSLAPVAVDGRPERFLLEVVGDVGRCELFLEAADARGWGFAYLMGEVDSDRPTLLTADALRPCESWGAYREHLPDPVLLPIQFHRLRLVMRAECRGLNLGLRALYATGPVTLVPPGIATGGDQGV